jgi:predicted GIY-YIG superfamily endonuclease
VEWKLNDIELRIHQKKARVKSLGKGFVYILRLERGKYYVGLTTSPVRRLGQHFSGIGAAWTRKYRPRDIEIVKPGNADEEFKLTLEMVRLHGWQNVRGSYFCATRNFELPSIVKENNYGEIRKRYPNAYKIWTYRAERKLLILKMLGSTTEDIAKIMGRQESAIFSRLKKLRYHKHVWNS